MESAAEWRAVQTPDALRSPLFTACLELVWRFSETLEFQTLARWPKFMHTFINLFICFLACRSDTGRLLIALSAYLHFRFAHKRKQIIGHK